MQNVASEIETVVKLCASAVSPELQKDAIEKFFTPNASFNHPLCKVDAGPGSRDKILGLYQWYREMSPQLDLEVEGWAWDSHRKKVFVNVVQTLHIWFNPFKSAPARLVVQLTLEERNGLYYITSQEDYYHSEDLISIILPLLSKPIIFSKYIATWFSNFNASLFQTFGFWKPRPHGHSE